MSLLVYLEVDDTHIKDILNHKDGLSHNKDIRSNFLVCITLCFLKYKAVESLVCILFKPFGFTQL